jgi:hypothetical protein
MVFGGGSVAKLLKWVSQTLLPSVLLCEGDEVLLFDNESSVVEQRFSIVKGAGGILYGLMKVNYKELALYKTASTMGRSFEIIIEAAVEVDDY